jgi:DNA-binding IclR family transcriptional regulator
LTDQSDVRLVELTVEVLLSLAAHTQGATLAQLADDAEGSVEEVQRSLGILARLGLSEEDPVFVHRYRLGDRAARLGVSGYNIALRKRAWPYLQQLHERTKEKAALAVIEGDCHRFIDECPHQPQSVLAQLPSLRYAEPAQLRTGSTAKVILAFLPQELAERILAHNANVPDASNEAYKDIEAWRRAAPSREELARIRQAGYASSRGERGITTSNVSLSAAVFDRTGMVCAALWIGGTLPEQQEEVATLLVHAARKLSAELGYVAPESNSKA